jgi:REP element-mobilizing transposase RayT
MIGDLDRYWLLTWTTYGTWLPGDARGFVSPVPLPGGGYVLQNEPESEIASDRPDLHSQAKRLLKGEAVWLSATQAETLLGQFLETAAYRNCRLFAVAVMANHCHLVVGVLGDPEPADMLRDFKAYGGRALNRRWRKPTGATWWTQSGSRRKLPNENAVLSAVNYVVRQERPLVIWTDDIPELGMTRGRKNV